MNAPFCPPDQKNFASMTGHADKWRGECIQYFAELEQIVEDLLHQLAGKSKSGKRVKLGQPVGAAFAHLRELTNAKGPFASKGKAISSTLAELAVWFEWRAHLTHGTLTVWRGRDDKWLLAFAHRPANDGTVRTYAITWNDAGELGKCLRKQVTALRENARSLTNAVRGA